MRNNNNLYTVKQAIKQANASYNVAVLYDDVIISTNTGVINLQCY